MSDERLNDEVAPFNINPEANTTMIKNTDRATSFGVCTDVSAFSRPSVSTPTITVVDAIMGSGKTTWMVDHLDRKAVSDMGTMFDHDTPERRSFIYVAPTLDEVERVIRTSEHVEFRQPLAMGGRKADHLRQLVEDGESICTTHALFQNVTPDLIALIRRRRYVLVIDEALSVVETYQLSQDDRRLLDSGGLITDGEARGRLVWNTSEHDGYRGKFETLKGLCQQGSLFGDPSGQVIWEFPVAFLDAFEEVFILTYLFEGAPMACWLRSHGVDWRTMTVAGGALVDRSKVDDRPRLREIADLVEIYEGKSNRVGAAVVVEGRRSMQPLSANWFRKDREGGGGGAKTLKGAATNFFRRVSGTPSKENGWTTFKDFRQPLQAKGYARGFIPVNAKATNDYAGKTALAYLANIFPHPLIANHCARHQAPFEADVYALSEMVQWVWRSAIRNGEPIDLFVPSERMRGLLKGWLKTGRVVEVG